MARILWSPEEFSGTNELVANWTRTGSGTWTYVTTGHGFVPRTDLSGGGGSYLMAGSSNANDTTATSTPFAPTNHGHAQFGFGCGDALSDMRFHLLSIVSAISVRIDQINLGLLTVGDSTGTLFTSAFVPDRDRWYHCSLEYYIHASAGWIKVWADGVQIVDYSGAVVGSTIEKARFQNEQQVVHDDLLINSLTLRYKNGGGTFAPSVGDTITGTAGGAPTCIVTAISGDGTSGYLTVEGWEDGTDPAYTDAQVITEDGGATTAEVDAPNSAFKSGFEPNSTRMLNEFMVVGVPDGAGGFTQLTPTGGANYTNVNDIPVATGTYNQADAAAEQDTYTHNTSSVIAATDKVTCVGVMAYARSSLTGIDGTELLLRHSGGTVYAADRQGLPSAYGAIIASWDARPDNDAGWTRDGIVTDFPQLGIRFVV